MGVCIIRFGKVRKGYFHVFINIDKERSVENICVTVVTITVYLLFISFPQCHWYCTSISNSHFSYCIWMVLIMLVCILASVVCVSSSGFNTYQWGFEKDTQEMTEFCQLSLYTTLQTSTVKTNCLTWGVVSIMPLNKRPLCRIYLCFQALWSLEASLPSLRCIFILQPHVGKRWLESVTWPELLWNGCFEDGGQVCDHSLSVKLIWLQFCDRLGSRWQLLAIFLWKIWQLTVRRWQKSQICCHLQIHIKQNSTVTSFSQNITDLKQKFQKDSVMLLLQFNHLTKMT